MSMLNPKKSQWVVPGLLYFLQYRNRYVNLMIIIHPKHPRFRFYISDPIKSVDGTRYWQICSSPGRDKEVFKIIV